jgi:hypothetical protein
MAAARVPLGSDPVARRALFPGRLTRPWIRATRGQRRASERTASIEAWGSLRRPGGAGEAVVEKRIAGWVPPERTCGVLTRGAEPRNAGGGGAHL